LIPARNQLLIMDGAGHDLGFKGKLRNQELPAAVLSSFQGGFL
jgi:hypothetical protein